MMKAGASWPVRGFLVLFLFCFLAGCGSRTITGIVSPAQGGKAQQVVNRALTQLKKPYRSGGESPKRGFDCSGLIWWAYHENGISVPRITKDQARAGIAVKASKKNMRPADILVFRTGQGAHGLHTGLYIGGGRFVHSPRSGSRVRCDEISQSYWKKCLIKVRRIIR